jgi:hypothetical protein
MAEDGRGGNDGAWEPFVVGIPGVVSGPGAVVSVP